MEQPFFPLSLPLYPLASPHQSNLAIPQAALPDLAQLEARALGSSGDLRGCRFGCLATEPSPGQKVNSMAALGEVSPQMVVNLKRK